MNRTIRLRIGGVEALAEMFDDAAPNFCNWFWGHLPLTLRFQHTSFAGDQVFTVFTGDLFTDMDRESPQAFVLPGDLIYAYRAPYQGRGAPNPLSEIAFYYGPNGQRWTAKGYGFVRQEFQGSTVWARVTQGLEQIAAQCALVRTEGASTIQVDRVLAANPGKVESQGNSNDPN